MPTTHLGQLLAVLHLATWTCAQDESVLPPLPLTFTAAPAGGLRVEVVDAVTGEAVDGAGFRWLQPHDRTDDGRGYVLPRGIHWFETSSPDHVTRREAYRNKATRPAGVLRVPVLPRLLVIRGAVRPAIACTIAAPAELALSPLLPPATTADANGRFVLVVRDRDQVQLEIGFLGRTASVEVPPQPRTPTHLPPFRDVPITEVEHALELTEPEAAEIGRSQRLERRRSKTAKAWVAAAGAGVDWLVAHQDQDGRWDADGFMKHDLAGEPCDGPGSPLVDVGVTGLALLALLGDGQSTIAGRHAASVRRAVGWLLQQRIQHDLMQPLETEVIAGNHIQQHCIATLALCRACSRGGDEEWRPIVQRVVDYIELHRNPYAVWSYESRSGDNRMTSTMWATLALVEAAAAGFRINDKALEYAGTYVDDMTDRSGRTGYYERGSVSGRHAGEHEVRFPANANETMTAAGLLVRASLGQSSDSTPLLATSVALLSGKPPRWDVKAGCIDYYGWALGTRAMWQLGRARWAPWAKAVTAAVVDQQRLDGNFRGSWDPIDVWGDDGGRVYATAMLVWGLEAPWDD